MQIANFISGSAVGDLVGCLLLVDVDGTLLDADEAALVSFGCSRPELLALGLAGVCAPSEVDLMSRLLHAAESGGSVRAQHRGCDGLALRCRAAPRTRSRR